MSTPSYKPYRPFSWPWFVGGHVLLILSLFLLYFSAFYAWVTATPQGRTRPNRIAAQVSCGLVPVCVAGAVLMFVRCRSRQSIGGCSKCGYDLQGLRSEKCPECGASIDVSTP